MKKNTRDYGKFDQRFAEGGSVKDDKNPILQAGDYEGPTSPAQYYYNSRKMLESGKYGDHSLESQKDISRNVALKVAKQFGYETGDEPENTYKGYKRGGPVRKRKRI